MELGDFWAPLDSGRGGVVLSCMTPQDVRPRTGAFRLATF